MTSTISCRTRKTRTNYLLLRRQLSETNSPTRPLLVLSSLQGAHEASWKHSSKTRRPLLSTKPLLSNPPTLINSSHNLLSPYQKILPTISPNNQPAASSSCQQSAYPIVRRISPQLVLYDKLSQQPASLISSSQRIVSYD